MLDWLVVNLCEAQENFFIVLQPFVLLWIFISKRHRGGTTGKVLLLKYLFISKLSDLVVQSATEWAHLCCNGEVIVIVM